jgi:hypothetical protein
MTASDAFLISSSVSNARHLPSRSTGQIQSNALTHKPPVSPLLVKRRLAENSSQQLHMLWSALHKPDLSYLWTSSQIATRNRQSVRVSTVAVSVRRLANKAPTHSLPCLRQCPAKDPRSTISAPSNGIEQSKHHLTMPKPG